DLKIDTAFNPVFSYTVSVDVTDINGETHSASEIVRAGYRSFQLNAITKEELNTQEPLEVSVGITNMNELPVKADVKITLQKLDAPNRVTRERYWETPDVFVISEHEYRKAFPTDIYANEDDPLTWKSSAVVKSINDTAKGTRKFRLSDNATPGYYLLNIIADKNGEQINSKQVIRVTGPDANGNAYAKIIAKDTVNGAVADYTIETNLPGLMITSQDMQPDTAKAYQQKSVKGQLKENIQVVSNLTRVDMAGVYNNRYYADSKEIRKIEPGSELNVEVQSFRNKTMPGSHEQWTIKVTGKDKQPVELATVMYDASLDMIRNHAWNLPEVGDATSINAPIFKKGTDFNTLVSANRTFNEPVYESFEKTYDELRFDPLSRQRQSMLYGSRAPLSQRLQGKAAGIAVQNADAKMEEVVVVGYGNETKKNLLSSSAIKSSSSITPRKDMRETAFFYPALQPKPDGSIELNFTMPEALTSWKWMAMAHDKQLNFGYLEKMIQTQKPLMVQPNMPRFLREGDRLSLSAKIVNMSDKELTGQVELQLIDPETNQPVDGWFRNFFPNQYFTAAAGESVVSDFSIEVPFQYAKPVITRLFVRSDSLTDGEENMI
ncbi:MAG TPA: alpha-2-macroglobulin family protein, partial [Oculatellaceae cyanobacterium]